MLHLTLEEISNASFDVVLHVFYTVDLCSFFYFYVSGVKLSCP